MSRLRHKHHIDFEEYSDFKTAWANTDPKYLRGWDRLAINNRTSTYAMVWSLYKIFVTRLSDPTITNFLYIGDQFPNIQMLWPLGSYAIPIATLGQAKCGWAILNLTEQNALT